jgi:RNA polymerase sigma factor (sigma-70 family)
MDDVAFERIYRRHAAAVRAYVARRAASGEVDDALADAWAVAWRRRDDLPDNPLPWLYGTARRVLANQRRGRARLRALLDKVKTLDDVQLADGALAEALGRLSEPDREALLLTAWEGLSGQEAAVAMRCSISAFHTRLHRARKRLATELAAIETEPPVSLTTVEANQ